VDLVLSCEHATFEVPGALQEVLAIPDEVAEGHRGWDPAAAWTAQRLAEAFDAPLMLGRVGRLAVDLNRSAQNPQVWSEYALRLAPAERAALMRDHHAPHWAAVEAAVGACDGALHISVHSFTPELDGDIRTMDIGLLYDPWRTLEAELAPPWRDRLLQAGLRTALNQPYRGWDDGITRGMRTRFGPFAYAGFELEINQARVVEGRIEHDVLDAIRSSVAELLSMHPRGSLGARRAAPRRT